jgi:predicted nucleic acid-binding protein
MRASLPRRVYWDACTFIGLLNREPRKADDCTDVWKEAEAGNTLIYTSFMSFAEVFKTKCDGEHTKPLSEEDDKRIEDLLRQRFIKPVVVDERIGIAARRLMRHYQECKKPIDGIHLATAMALNVDEMHTFDRDLQKLSGKVNRADGKPLKICLPYPVAPPPPQLFDGVP